MDKNTKMLEREVNYQNGSTIFHNHFQINFVKNIMQNTIKDIYHVITPLDLDVQ